MDQEQYNEITMPKFINDTFLKESELMKQWNQRAILLDTSQRTLQIVQTSGQNSKILPLSEYRAEIIQRSKDNEPFIIQLTAVNQQNKNLKYKQVRLGDNNEQKVNLWFNYIQKLIQGNFILEQKITIKSKVQETQQQQLQTSQVQKVESIEIQQQKSDLSIDEEETKVESEKEIHECQLLPYFSYFPNAQMPKQDQQIHKTYTSKQIHDITQKLVNKSPLLFSDQITKLVAWCLKTQGKDLLASTSQNFQFLHQKNFNTVFQSNQNQQLFRGILLCKNSPQEIYETILLPNQENWHPSIQQFSILPNEDDDSAIILNVLNFQKDKCTFVDKQIVYYRYGFVCQNFYFIICLSRQDQVNLEQTEKNNVFIVHRIFQDPNDNKQTLFSTDLVFDFQNESYSDIKRNVIKYLLNIMYINHNPPEKKDQKQLIIEQYSNKKSKKVINLNDPIIEQYGSGSVSLNNNHNEDDLFSLYVKYDYNKPVKVYKYSKPAWIPGDYEEEMSKENLLKLLQDVEKNDHIERAIRTYHEMNYIEPVDKDNKLKSTKEKGHYCIRFDYVRNEKTGGLIYTNDDLVNEQRTVFFSLIKRVGSNFLTGKSIMSISMPVTIFDPKSYQQRIARSFGHATNFLYKAGLETDVVEQIKQCSAFNCAMFIMQFMQEKPFNPILGETLQGRLNGYPIYMEQVSHHPPITYYYHIGPNYKLYGQSSCDVNMGANSLQGIQKGQPTVFFTNTKTIIKIIQQPFTVFNTAIGKRSFNCVGRAFIYAPKERIVCEIIYNPNDKGAISNFFSRSDYKIDEISGSIFKVKQEIIDQLDQLHKANSNSKRDLQINPQKDVEAYLSKCEGIWHKLLMFDKEVYFDDSRDLPHILEYEAGPLPSDSIFRSDLIWLNINDKVKSQEEKESLENLQRKDAKLRKAHEENIKKNNNNNKKNIH